MKDDSNQFGFQTRALHHGHDASDPYGAVSPPIYMTSTFAFENTEDAASVFAGAKGRYVYGRQHNPTQNLLETRLAELEGAEAGLVTGSGMGAITATLWTLLSAGDELIVHQTMYSTATSLVEDGLPRFGIKVTKVDLRDPENLRRAITDKTKLVYFETPVNPTAELLHISAIAKIAHEHPGVRVLVDSTFGSPALQRPLDHGADLVVHSMTKYINGHGDLLAGAVLGNLETLKQIRAVGLKYMTGSTLSPLLCFLVLRGIKTLKMRMREHSESALKVAAFLEAHPAVKVVRYGHLPSSPDHKLAKEQMSAGGGMISFELHSGFDGAVKVIDQLKLISRAISLGDTESLVTHPASLVKARQKIDPSARLSKGVGVETVRLSVGLEDSEDIINDLRQALQAVS